MSIFIELPIGNFQNEKSRNEWGDYNVDQCVLCGRKLGKNPNMIHYLTNGNITNNPDGDIPDSQGFFEVGSECFKKLNKEFLLNK